MLRGIQRLVSISRVIESRPWVAPCLIVAAGSVCTLPLALFGFDHGDLIHLFWAKHFSDQLWEGNLLPQWLLDMNSGLGSPTFYFYGPVSYYITSIFFLILPYHRYGWLQVGLSAAVASVGSGLAAYLWLRQRSSRQAACIAAILYTWLPYHLRIDHLERFAFAEYWGFVWMPLSLYYREPAGSWLSAKHCRIGNYVCTFVDDSSAYSFAVWMRALFVCPRSCE